MDNQQLLDFVTKIPNKTIAEAFLKANEILANHDNIVVSISGGGTAI